MTPYETQLHVIADGVSDTINKAPSIDAAAAGIALGLFQALKGGAHNTPLWPERMAEVAAWIARSVLIEGGPPLALDLDTNERDRFMQHFREALLQFAGIELPPGERLRVD